MQMHKNRFSVWPTIMTAWLNSAPARSRSRQTLDRRMEEPGQALPSWGSSPYVQQRIASNSNSSIARPEMEG